MVISKSSLRMPANSTLITRQLSLLIKTSVLGIQCVSPVLLIRFATGAFCPAGYNGELTLHMRLDPMLYHMQGRFKPNHRVYLERGCLDQNLDTLAFSGLEHHTGHRARARSGTTAREAVLLREAARTHETPREHTSRKAHDGKGSNFLPSHANIITPFAPLATGEIRHYSIYTSSADHRPSWLRGDGCSVAYVRIQ